MTHTASRPTGPEGPKPAPWQTLGRIGARATDRTVAAVTECLAPDFPHLDRATHAVVLSEVTAFTTSQVGALPDFLRYPYRLALVAFEWLAVLRFGRPFVALDAERRRAWVDLWAESPLGATRNFVKLMRSCALLAFYDHPALQAPLRAQGMRGADRSTVSPATAADAAPMAPPVGVAS